MNIAALLNIPFKAAQARLIEDLAEAGYADIKAMHGHVFAFLDRESGSLIADLVAKSTQSKQYINKLVNELEEAGYVTRKVVTEDRRAKRVMLTRRGRNAVEAADRSFERTEQLWKQRLGANDMTQLRQLLFALLPHLK